MSRSQRGSLCSGRRNGDARISACQGHSCEASAWPERGEKLIARDDLAGAFRHVDEHGHDLEVELAGAASAGQLAGGRIDAELSDSKALFEVTVGPSLRPRVHGLCQRWST